MFNAALAETAYRLPNRQTPTRDEGIILRAGSNAPIIWLSILVEPSARSCQILQSTFQDSASIFHRDPALFQLTLAVQRQGPSREHLGSAASSRRVYFCQAHLWILSDLAVAPQDWRLEQMPLPC